MDASAAITRSGSIQDFVAELAYTKPQFSVLVTSTFAGIGLALVLFSVRAYTVALQTHQIGIRMALGAQRGDVLAMILWQGLRLVSIGILIGVGAGAGVAQFFGIQDNGGLSRYQPDRVSFPARRATQLDPLRAVRYE